MEVIYFRQEDNFSLLTIFHLDSTTIGIAEGVHRIFIFKFIHTLQLESFITFKKVIETQVDDYNTLCMEVYDGTTMERSAVVR